MFIRKPISLFISFCLILEQSVFAQSIDLSAHFANFGRSIAQSDKFRPLHLRYLGYDNLSQDFKLLLDKGDTKKEDLENKAYIEENTQTLLKYFFIGLTLPNDKFWVNLRPDSPEDILDPDLEKTDIGRIFLEADLQLKKDTAQWTSPQTKEGKVYWDKLYQKAGELFGTENITIPTLTRPWIVPNEIIIRESPDDAYIYKATLKVMLEEDYLTSRGGSRTAPTPDQYTFSDPRLKELNQYSTQLLKEQILPKLTYEVNTSKRYAPLRQVYYSLIFAQWFKARYRSQKTEDRLQRTEQTNPLRLIDTRDLTGLTSKQPWSKTTYFKEYQKSFKEGEYNLSEPVYTPMGQSIRRYMSGGIKRIAPQIPPFGNSPITDSETGSKITTLPGRVWRGVLLRYVLPLLITIGISGVNIVVEPNSKTELLPQSYTLQQRENNHQERQYDTVAKYDIFVFQRQAGILEKKGFIATAGLAPCVALVLYDKENQIGVLGHFDALTDLSASFSNIFSAISTLKGEIENLTARIFSGLELNEKLINSLITKLEQRRIKIEQIDRYTRRSTLALDVATGKVYDYTGKVPISEVPSSLEVMELSIPGAITIVPEIAGEKPVPFKDSPIEVEVVYGFQRISMSRQGKRYLYQEGRWIIIEPGEVKYKEREMSAGEKEKFIQGIKSALPKLSPEERKIVEKVLSSSSSSLTQHKPTVSSSAFGGIDFTRLPIVTQAITNLGSSPLRPSSYPSLRQLNLSEEYQAIERLASSGITPSPERLKSFLQASCLQENIGEEKDNVLGLLTDILRDEESSLRPAEPGLRDILVVLESATSPQQLKEIFLGKN